MEEILSLLNNNEMSLKEILSSFRNVSESDIILNLNKLFLENKIIKIKKNQQILFYLNKNKEYIDYNGNCNESTTDIPSSQKISQLARKFRSSRYTVERDIVENDVNFSLKISKKEKKYYILFISEMDKCDDFSLFDKILMVDCSIRIVVDNDKIKQKLSQIFDTFVKINYGLDNGYVEFRQKHSFYVLTYEEFFIKTTWKTLVK